MTGRSRRQRRVEDVVKWIPITHYLFEGFIQGALRTIVGSDGIESDHRKIICEEIQCAAMKRHDRCLIRFIETDQ